MTRRGAKDARTYGRGLLAGFVLLGLMVSAMFVKPARAAICPDCSCITAAHAVTQGIIVAEHQITRNYFGTAAPIPTGTGMLGSHQVWLDQVFFKQYILPALQIMTEQLVTSMMNQVMAIGAIIDAKHQLETQRLFQQLTARAHKDYHPGIGMCVIGTAVGSLAATERNADLSVFAFSQREQDRALANKSANAAEGPDEDREGRFRQFKAHFCDQYDNNRLQKNVKTGFGYFCDGSVLTKGDPNADIDFTRLVMLPGTLREHLADTTANDPTKFPHHAALVAMADNLYGHDVFRAPAKGISGAEEVRDSVMDMRSVVAMRSVAQNTFNALVGLKTMGTGDPHSSPDTAGYMTVILKQLGMPDDDIPRVLGDLYSGERRPSYYAQMEILSKKLYQRPEFYADLYDTPANVERKKAAMKAIRSMLNRDIFDSYLRNEAIVSQILELQTIKAQQEVQDEMGGLKSDSSK